MITSDSFVPGVECMLFSLKETKTKVSVVLIVTRQVSKRNIEKLSEKADRVVVVDAIGNPHAEKSHVEGWVNSGYTKLQIWNLVDYDKVVYIDADTLVLQNVDELFERPTPAAAPDTFPPDKFNAGVMVIRPSTDTFKDMMSKINVLGSYDTGDTGFLNEYFPKWFEMSAGHRLPFGYNALRTMYWLTAPRTKGYWNAVKPLKIIHYCSSPKPWDSEGTKKKGELELKWWSFFVRSQMGGGVDLLRGF